MSTPPLTTVADRTQPKSAFLSVHGVGWGSDVVSNGVRAGLGVAEEVDVGVGVGVALGVVLSGDWLGLGPLCGDDEPHAATVIRASMSATPTNIRFGMSEVSGFASRITEDGTPVAPP